MAKQNTPKVTKVKKVQDQTNSSNDFIQTQEINQITIEEIEDEAEIEQIKKEAIAKAKALEEAEAIAEAESKSAIKTGKYHISDYKKASWLELLVAVKHFDFQVYARLTSKGESSENRKWLVSYFKTKIQ
jgi:hypothetical protein